MLSFKESVRGYCKTGVVRPQIWDAMVIANKVYNDFGYDCIVTSLCDGKHSKNSKHYEGNGVDLRIRHLLDGEPQQIRDVLANRLGPEYDVILENTHIHIEYDPKEQ